MDGPVNNVSWEASGDHRQRRTRVLLVALETMPGPLCHAVREDHSSALWV